jgi:glycosyltransferase involved in cell wall biosynthesis
MHESPSSRGLNEENTDLTLPAIKVGMIVHAYYLKDARVRRYAELLAAQGHEVDVFCLREGDEPKKARHLGVNIYRVNVGRIRSGKLSYVYEYFASFVRFFAKLNGAYLTGRRYDVLHIHNMPDILVFCAAFQKLSGTKIILDIHDLMPEVYQSKYELQEDHWLPKLLRAEERFSTWFATAVITANHAFADILVRRGIPRSKVSVVMNAAEDMFFMSNIASASRRANKTTRDFHAIYIGTLAPRYGVETAVRALAKLKREGSIPGLRFSIIPKIANEGDEVGKILAEIERTGLSSAFQMMEPVQHHQMPAVIATADVMMYTPTPDIHMDIALSLKIPEAIAAGCPIVASRLSVHERYFGEDALFMFQPGNVDECAAKVFEVYADPARTALKLKHARERLAAIDWGKQSEVYLRLIRSLTMEPKGLIHD